MGTSARHHNSVERIGPFADCRHRSSQDLDKVLTLSARFLSLLPKGNLLMSRRKNLNIKRKSVFVSACAIVGWSFLGNLSTLSVGRIAEKALDLSLASNQSERSFVSD